MEISKTLEDKENKLLNRKEIKLLVKADKAPSKQETIKLIAEKENKPEENIIIERIKGKFGRDTFLIEAKAYNTKEDKEKIEKVKKKKGEEEKKEEAKTEEPKKEVEKEKKEEPVEEAKPEEKKEERKNFFLQAEDGIRDKGM